MMRTEHISLLLTSGSGPAECQQAVANVLKQMGSEADEFAIDFDFSGERTKHGYKSAVVVISGLDASKFADTWRGTIQWRAKSTVRPGHKRENWFIGVFDLPSISDVTSKVDIREITYDTFRAGGPGGQHQNTTDSAVRATHRPSGISAVAREERSQHRNKALALERLQHLITSTQKAEEAARKQSLNGMHRALERGNPVRCFKGHNFKEVKGVSV